MMLYLNRLKNLSERAEGSEPMFASIGKRIFFRWKQIGQRHNPFRLRAATLFRIETVIAKPAVPTWKVK